MGEDTDIKKFDSKKEIKNFADRTRAVIFSKNDLSMPDMSGVNFGMTDASGTDIDVDVSGNANVVKSLPTVVDYFYIKLFFVSLALFCFMALPYWGADTYLRDEIVKLWNTQDRWERKKYDEDGNENKNYFWYLFGRQTITAQTAIMVALWFMLFVLTSTTAAMYKSKAPSSKILNIVTVCYLGLVVPVFLLLSFADFFTKIFANTLGFWWVDLDGSLTELMKELIHSKRIEKLPMSLAFLITTMDLPNFNAMYKTLTGNQPVNQSANELSFDFYMKELGHEPGENDKFKENIENLLKKIVSKNSVGHFVWIYFSSILCVIVSVGALIM